MNYEFRFVVASKINKIIYLHESQIISSEVKNKFDDEIFRKIFNIDIEKFAKSDHPTKTGNQRSSIAIRGVGKFIKGQKRSIKHSDENGTIIRSHKVHKATQANSDVWMVQFRRLKIRLKIIFQQKTDVC